MRGLVGSREGVDALEKKEISFPCRELNYDPSVIHTVTQSLHRMRYVGFSSQKTADLKGWNVVWHPEKQI
jgi:hypothetical protein